MQMKYQRPRGLIDARWMMVVHVHVTQRKGLYEHNPEGTRVFHTPWRYPPELRLWQPWRTCKWRSAEKTTCVPNTLRSGLRSLAGLRHAEGASRASELRIAHANSSAASKLGHDTSAVGALSHRFAAGRAALHRGSNNPTGAQPRVPVYVGRAAPYGVGYAERVCRRVQRKGGGRTSRSYALCETGAGSPQGTVRNNGVRVCRSDADLRLHSLYAEVVEDGAHACNLHLASFVLPSVLCQRYPHTRERSAPRGAPRP